MINNNTVMLLRDALAAGREYADALLREDTPIVCVNKHTNKDRLISFKVLYGNNNRFWQQNETWEYFLAKTDFANIKNKLQAAKLNLEIKPAVPAEAKPAVQPAVEIEELVSIADNAPMENFGTEYDAIAAMTEEQRVQQLQEDKKRLDALILQRPRDNTLVTGALVDTTRDAALVNRATLMNAMHIVDSEAKKMTQSLVDSTWAMVKSSAQLISPDIFNNDLMHTLVEKSNGTVIQHMTRVYLQGLAFLAYYNKLLSTSSIVNKLRISFDNNRRAFYHALLPHIPPDVFTLEMIFHGGMRIIPEKEFFNWATGFLIHDIGKASAVEYHEGEAAYNRDIVTEHVKLGYNSVMNKTNYPREAALITGYHHEYYGDSTGYGYFRLYLDQYKKANPHAHAECAISYDMESLLDYHALAYFPAKVLEIIDVYDSITDPNRKYRKPMTPEEALAMMEEEFIVKHHKLDMILFEIFAGFVRSQQRS